MKKEEIEAKVVDIKIDLGLQAEEIGMEISVEDALDGTLAAIVKQNEGWMVSKQSTAVLNAARTMRKQNTKRSILHSIPLVCKSYDCPFRETCPLFEHEIAPQGERCPIEIAAIEDLFDRYCQELGVNPEDPENTIDTMMVKEVVDTDILLLRCDNKLAVDADFIVENVVGEDRDGNPISSKALHTASTYKEQLRSSKYKTLQLLNSTRRDKKEDSNKKQTEAERVAEMMAVMAEAGMQIDEERKRREAFLGTGTAGEIEMKNEVEEGEYVEGEYEEMEE
ncbi:hypothetical protein ACQR3P_28635 [Rhodococcus sp. IEGM1300]